MDEAPGLQCNTHNQSKEFFIPGSRRDGRFGFPDGLGVVCHTF